MMFVAELFCIDPSLQWQQQFSVIFLAMVNAIGRPPLVVDVGANVGCLSALHCFPGLSVASFEPNRNPRRYLETFAGSPRPASPQMDEPFCGNICLREVGSCDIKAYKKCITFAQLNSGLKQN